MYSRLRLAFQGLLKTLLLVSMFFVGIVLIQKTLFNVSMGKEDETMKNKYRKSCLIIAKSVTEFALGVSSSIVASLLQA